MSKRKPPTTTKLAAAAALADTVRKQAIETRRSAAAAARYLRSLVPSETNLRAAAAAVAARNGADELASKADRIEALVQAAATERAAFAVAAVDVETRVIELLCNDRVAVAIEEWAAGLEPGARYTAEARALCEQLADLIYKETRG